MRVLFLFFTISSILFTPLIALANGEDEEHHQMMADWMWSGQAWFGWVFVILMWIAIVVAIIVLIKWFLERSKTPIDILKERYAKGEISKTKFKEMMRELEGPRRKK